MKTLKQIYNEVFEKRLKEKHWINIPDMINEAVKEWLTQKRQEHNDCECSAIKELLEELEQ